MTESDLDRAKGMFFGYEGSHLDMIRDGVEDAYLELHVPPEVEQSWLDELTRSKLSKLGEPGNWQSVLFLAGHRDHRHLDDVLAVGPQGVWWERISYYEALLKYVDMACRERLEPQRLAQICRDVAERAGELAATAPDDQRPDRTTLLMEAANRLEASFFRL